MPASYTIVGTGNADFGTANAGAGTYGVIVSGSSQETGDKLEIKDKNGNVYLVIFFNEKNECEIDVIFDNTITPPARGALLSICGLTSVICDGWTKKWENEKECMLTIKGTKYIANSVGGA